jgi:hypothetical protein
LALKLTAIEMIDLQYPEKEWLRVYTDGSQADEANTQLEKDYNASTSHSKLLLVQTNKTLMLK